MASFPRPRYSVCPFLPSRLLGLFFGLYGLGTLFVVAGENPPVEWNHDELFAVPAASPAPAEYAVEGVQSALLDGLPFQGKPTKVFAYYGVPAAADGGKVPGMVLIHGGGGTAFADWVKLWNGRGYAAIAVDTCGCFPGGKHGQRPRNPEGGPAGWDASFAQIDGPLADQWQYHAIAAVVRSHSFLRAQPGVDPERIGLTGISWGGYLTCLVSGVDDRFKFAAPVYGCGFLGENSAWRDRLEKLGETGRKWQDQWDPRHFLPAARMPLLWVNGTNDHFYPLDSWQKSYLAAPTVHTLSVGLRMKHGQNEGATPPAIHAFAQAAFAGQPALASVARPTLAGQTLAAKYESASPLTKAELLFTKDEGNWEKRAWEIAPAQLDQEGQVTAQLPAGTKVCFFNLIDSRQLTISSEHLVLP